VLKASGTTIAVITRARSTGGVMGVFIECTGIDAVTD
jgi:hypothetical protein